MSLQIGLSIATRMKQELKLTPQLQLAIRHLQLARADLVEEIQRELMNNPLLEERGASLEQGTSASERDRSANSALESSTPQDHASEYSSGLEQSPQEGLDFTSMTQAAEARKEMEWDQYFEERRPRRELDPIRVAQEDYLSPEMNYTRSSTLSEHLLEQVQLSNFSVSEQQIAEELIWNLDEHGYLVGVSAEDIATMLEVDLELVEEVIESLLQFDPIGVGARSLKECLLAQALNRGSTDLMRRLIEGHLEDVAHNRLPQVARQLKLEMPQLHELLQELRRFEPHPGRRFGGGTTSYVTPDVYIEWEDGELKVRANSDGFPQLRINGHYRDQLRETLKRGDARRKSRGRKERSSDALSEGRRYVTERLSAAQSFINSLQQRKQTIVLVTECIIEFQRDFFLHGPEHLKPLVLRQIAEKLDLHESTVSRATSHKFVHTPRGLFELKYFFHSKIQSNDGSDDLASQAVKVKIKNLITQEDPRKPLSDQALTELLADEGVSIARRTVAKYREAMGILSSSKRRQHV